MPFLFFIIEIENRLCYYKKAKFNVERRGNMKIKKILVVFKTHLDIGFTDFAENVTEKYMNQFIPGAIKVARELREAGGEARFKWTTGSWLIYEYLMRKGEKECAELAQAIEQGDICWHGLPCTTHTEIMDKELFKYALSLSQRLDKKFGTKTIAAKMTDVPGHTKAMIPFMKEAGIELLHIGVNEASAVPDVPEIFRWKADNGDMINVIYNGEYGNFTKLGDTGTALWFAHTLDNLGAQKAEEIVEIFRSLRQQFPEAELKAANLNDVAIALREAEDSLPVITDEIGDSWIHGTGTDPKKICQFRALEKLYASLPEGEDKENLARGLLLISEHTWGLDEKTHLHDNVHYKRSEFESLRGEPNYQKMEASWREQRQFMYSAVEKLSEENKQKAYALMAEAEREILSTDDFQKINANEKFDGENYSIRFNDNGEIDFLSLNGEVVADENHKLTSLLYQSFSYDDYLTFHKRYHRIEDDWAYQDFTKVGMENEHKEFTAKGEAFKNGNSFVVKYTFPKEATDFLGAPEKADLLIEIKDGSVHFDFAWFNKPANRMAEAMWIGFNPVGSNRKIRKLGTFIDPQNVVSRGNRSLHATDWGVSFDNLTIECVDSTLVSPCKPCVLQFADVIPNEADGFYFGLHNNLWGTNFPMWYGENARFRFNLNLG